MFADARARRPGFQARVTTFPGPGFQAQAPRDRATVRTSNVLHARVCSSADGWQRQAFGERQFRRANFRAWCTCAQHTHV
eukprot:3943149-Alexandrium_andersonii.AAC.1